MAFSGGGAIVALAPNELVDAFTGDAVSGDEQGMVFALPPRPFGQGPARRVTWEMTPGAVAPATLDLDFIAGFSVDASGDIVNPTQLDTHNAVSYYSRSVDVGNYHFLGLRKRNHTGAGSTFTGRLSL